MTTVFNAPLRTFNLPDLQQLKAKHPDAMVRIEVRELDSTFSEKQFWSILNRLDWGRQRSADIVAPAVEVLSQFSEKDIFSFEDILSQKLYALDGEQFAKPLGWGRDDGQGFSVDGFLYARCGVVANGQIFYEKVLQNPALMSPEYSFEPLLYLAEKAYRLKTSTDDYDYLPALSCETFSNHDGWPEMPTLQELIVGKP